MNKRTPSQAARQIATELGQSSPKGTARLACALKEQNVTHTPGPWIASDCGIYAHTTEKGIRGMGLRVASASRYDNAQEPGHSTVSEAEANAKLIAAAPELLEVARAIDEAWTGGESGDWRGALDNALLLARAAISRATA